jgi:RNA polymerase sigma factor (sigma-70 family)
VNDPKYAHISDQELMDMYAQSHDNKWLGVLLERHTILIYGVCMKYLRNSAEAKDLVQHIFLKVIADFERYKVENFKSWLYIVTMNLCNYRLRRKKRLIYELSLPDDNLEVAAGKGRLEDYPLEPDTEESWKQQNLEILPEAITELNPAQRECLTLFYLEHMSYQDIAQKTRYSISQVKSNIQNGKRNLRNILTGKIPPPNGK